MHPFAGLDTDAPRIAFADGSVYEGSWEETVGTFIAFGGARESGAVAGGATGQSSGPQGDPTWAAHTERVLRMHTLVKPANGTTQGARVAAEHGPGHGQPP